MITENKLTSYIFKEVAGTPSTWDLHPYIPEGILNLSTLQYRWRSADTYWTDWQPAVAFNAATQVATGPIPAGTVEVEWQRNTPRDRLYKDPLAATSRVAQPDLQINADQGMLVAIEWAASYGVDAHSPMVSGEAPRSLGLTQHSQNHFGPDAKYTRKVWNFRFTGGYLDRSHVKVQIKVAGVWQLLTLDYTAWDHEHPSSAPYRFLAPYQLYLDFGSLASQIEGMVIFRRTPREAEVATPQDAEIIDGPGMKPTATHAFFVAVELGEEMNRLVPACECQAVLTSKPYPIVLNPEGISSNLGVPDEWGRLVPPPNWTDTVDVNVSLIAGQLRDIQQKYRLDPESIDTNVALLSGTLVSALKPYTNAVPEPLDTNVALIAGTLTTILRPYPNHISEKLDTNVALISGTLT